MRAHLPSSDANGSAVEPLTAPAASEPETTAPHAGAGEIGVGYVNRQAREPVPAHLPIVRLAPAGHRTPFPDGEEAA